MGEYNFNNDLESLGAVFVDECNTFHYDFWVQYKDKILAYEVKTDDYCLIHNDTGNIFVEFEGRGKPSGISVSMSDWFVYYYLHLGEIWYIRTSELRELIENNDFKVSKNSGDVGSETKGYLINRHQFQNKFMVHRVPKPSWDIYNKLQS